MRAAVEDIEEGDGKAGGIISAEVAVEGEALGVGGGVGDGERDAEDRVRAKPSLVRCAVESIIARSTVACSRASMPRTASAITVFALLTACRTPRPP